MARRQTVSQPDFQLQRLVIVGPFKFSAHTSSLLGPPNQAALFSLRQTASKGGIPIVAYNKNYPPTDNQLWKFVSDGQNDGYGYFQSKSNLVLDILNGRTDPGT